MPRQLILFLSVEDDDGTNAKCWKKVLYLLCGLENHTDPTQIEISSPPPPTKEEEAEMAAAFLDEKPLWKMVCNVNAIILLAITVAICAYYA